MNPPITKPTRRETGPVSQPPDISQISSFLIPVNYLDAALERVILRLLATVPYGISPEVDRLALWASQQLRRQVMR